MPGELISAGDPSRSAKQRREEVLLQRHPSTVSGGRLQTSSTNTNKKIGGSNFRRSLTKKDEPTPDQPKSRRSRTPIRRSRTLSPKRTVVKESSAHTKYRNLHASLAMPKGYDTKELMDDTERVDIIKHPQRKYSNLLTKSPSSENLSSNALSNTTPKKDNTKKERKRRVSKELGYCSVHPNVQLTVVRTVSKSSKGGGSFNVVKESCPICAASALDLVAPDTTKVIKCKEVDITLDPPDTTKVLKPKCKAVDFSSSAPVVLYKPKRSTSRNDKKSSAAEVDKKEGEDQDDRRHLQNSTTRLLRRKGSDGKKSKEHTSGNTAVVTTEVDKKEGEDQVDDRRHLHNSTTRLMRRRSSEGKNVKERTSGNTMKKVKALDYFRA